MNTLFKQLFSLTLLIVAISTLSAGPAFSQRTGNEEGDDHVFRCPGIKLKSGKNTIQISGVHEGRTITDECHWELSAESTLTSSTGGSIEHSRFVPSGHQLHWSDEFDGTELDETKWSHRYEGKLRGQGLLSAKSVSLENGTLSLTTRKIDGQLHTGMLTTKGKFATTYGYFESRIRFQKLQGHHGSFWLQSDEQRKFPGDPSKGGAEIDVVEFFGSGRTDRGVGVNLYWIDEVKKQAHVGTSKLNLDSILGPKPKPGTKSKEGSDNSELPKEICEEFHVFAVEWTSEGYKYFVDGHLMLESSKGVSKRDEYMILSLLCHDWEAPRLMHDQLPDAMQVDYVRVYKLDPETVRKK